MNRKHFLLLLPAALAACATPPILGYQLQAVPGPAWGGFARTLAVRTPGLPSALDQDEVAAPAGGYRFNLYPNTAWAEPLGEMLQAVMVQNLAQRLPAATVLAGGGAIGVPPELTLEIEILAFAPDASLQVVLSGRAALRSSGHPSYTLLTLHGTAPMPTPDASGVAAAMSTLWAKAADNIAAAAAAMAAAGEN